MSLSKTGKRTAHSLVSKVKENERIGKDMTLLRDLVGALTDKAGEAGYDGRTAQTHLDAFCGMLDRMENGKQLSLTDKQREYASDVHKRYCSGETYRNDWSAGRVEKGKDVPLPEVLRPENLPKRPPTRRAS